MKQRTYARVISVVAVFISAALCAEMWIHFGDYHVGDYTKKDGDIAEVETRNSLYLNGDYVGFCPEETYTVQDTQDAIEAAADLFGLGESTEETLTEKAVVQTGNQSYYRFSQSYQGVPVFGREITLGVDGDGTVFLASGNYSVVEPETMTPQVTQDTALAKAEQYITDTLGDGPVEGLELMGLEDGNLCIYNLDSETDSRLAYDCKMSYEGASGGGSFDVVIDAVTGEILSLTDNVLVGYSYGYEFTEILSKDTYPLDLEQYGERYVFRDTTRNMELYSCGNNYLTFKNPNNIVYTGGNQFEVNDALLYASEEEGETNLDAELSVYECTIENGKWVNKEKEKGKAILLLSSVQQTYEFYQEVLNRKGFNDKNGTMLLVSDRHADAGLRGSDNACALTLPNLSIMLFNSNASVGNIALPAHEFTHAVEETISTMKNKGESGCLKEGYSDLFGELVLAHTTGQDPNWKLYGRDMSTPRRGKNVYYYQGLSKDTEVHDGSTVVSHCGYQIWQSWRESGMDVDTCVEKLATLLYRCLFLLPNQAKMADWRWAMESIGIHMLQEDELTAKQFSNMVSAMDESGIPRTIDSEQMQIWETAITELASLSIQEGTKNLTTGKMELAASRLLPLAADEIGPKGYELDSNSLYVEDFELSYVLYGLFGEEKGDAIQNDLTIFTYQDDPENSTTFEYLAPYEAPKAVNAGWKVKRTKWIMGGNRSFILHVFLTSPEGEECEARVLLERGEFPGVFFNGYSMVDFIVLEPELGEPSASTPPPEEPVQSCKEVLQNQLDALASQYGVIPLGEESYPEITGYGGGEELIDPARLTGLLGADIFDYDGDGQEELLTVRLEPEAGSDKGWGETQCFLTVYEWDSQTGKIVLSDEQSFLLGNFTNSIPHSALHLARGVFDNGKTALYFNYHWEMNSLSFGTLRISYDGTLQVDGGVECMEWYATMQCYHLKSSQNLGELGVHHFMEEQYGWEQMFSFNHPDDGITPSQSDIDSYRKCYQGAMAELGIEEYSPRGIWMNPEYPTGGGIQLCEPIDRESIAALPVQRSKAIDGTLTTLCGAYRLAAGVVVEEDVTLVCYDETGLLDSFR